MNLRERVARLKAEAGGDSRFAELVDILEKLEAQARRTQAEQSRLEERLARVENSAVFRTLRAMGQAGSSTKGRLGQALLRSPLHPLYARLTGAGAKGPDPAYAVWIEAEQASMMPPAVLSEESRSWAYQPRISILIPVYRPRREWIEAAIQSVRAQSYENWQLCVCCDGPVEPWLDDWLRRRVSEDPRVRVAFAAERRGIASALNGAGTLADGEYLTFLDQDDMLPPTALHFVVEALQYEEAGVLYSDEDWMSEGGRRLRPNFKPGWSPELLSGCMYFGHLFVARRERVADAGWFRDGFEGAQDYDLALRLIGAGAAVKHVPRVLYHWRMHAGSTAAGAGAKPHAHASGKRALKQALRANGVEASVVDGAIPHSYAVQWGPVRGGVTIVICSRTPALLERCLESIRRTEGGLRPQIVVVEHRSPGTRQVAETFECDVVSYGRVFHFADMNNAGAAEARHESLLFLNDDVTALHRGWLESLVALVERPGIAIAGAKLTYPSGAIQHAGIALGIGEGTGHIGRGKFASDLWRWLDLRRNVSAVTGACLAIRRGVFEELGGFDLDFPVNYNDADLCLRARAAGYEVIFEPAASLRHDECATRASGTKADERERFWQRWGDALDRPDPYFTRFLDGEDLRLVWGRDGS
jgi:GT2 family glycosyltransferase